MSVCVRELEREYTVYVKECYDCYEINALKEYAKCLVSTGRQERNRQERNLRTQIDCATIRVVRLRPNLAASRGWVTFKVSKFDVFQLRHQQRAFEEKSSRWTNQEERTITISKIIRYTAASKQYSKIVSLMRCIDYLYISHEYITRRTARTFYYYCT